MTDEREQRDSMEVAVAEAGGRDALDQLIIDARGFVPKEQVPAVSDMLRDPHWRPAAVRMLARMREHHRANPPANRPADLSNIRTVREYREVQERAIATDDPALWKALSAVNPNNLVL